VTVEFAWLAGVSTALLVVRGYAASHVGYGDSEALYASYAIHPQPAYLDHPGLVGVFARAIGGGTAPDPERAHVATSVLATAVPWAMALTCRACGASWRAALGAALVVALVPEMAIGLFAMTPDLLLSIAWIATLALAAVGLRAPAGSARASFGFAAAGVCAGAAAAAKVSGLLLLLALAVTYASRRVRDHARTAAPWAGLAAGVFVVLPIFTFEANTGWPMLHHRLVATQQGAGVSWHNAGAIVGGQLAYLSPLVVVLGACGARAAWRDRADPVGRLLWTTSALPAAVLVPLCLWSRVAEPHWLAPAWLALAPAAARAPQSVPRRLVVAALAMAACLVAAVHAWVLVPAAARLAPDSYDPQLDIANELYGWPVVVGAVRAEVIEAQTPLSSRGDVVVVGPHWVICGQIEAALRGDVPVGCDTPVTDDFDTWWPRALWRSADTIVWVTDTRFGPPPTLASYAPVRSREVRIDRAGRVVRVFTIMTLERRGVACAPFRPSGSAGRDVAQPLRKQVVAVRLPHGRRSLQVEVARPLDVAAAERRIPLPLVTEPRRSVLRVAEVHQKTPVAALEDRISRVRAVREKANDARIARRFEIGIANSGVPAVHAPEEVVGAPEDRVIRDEIPVLEDAEHFRPRYEFLDAQELGQGEPAPAHTQYARDVGAAKAQNLHELIPVVDLVKFELFDGSARENQSVQRTLPQSVLERDVRALDMVAVAAAVGVRPKPDPHGGYRKDGPGERPQHVRLVGLRAGHDVDDPHAQRRNPVAMRTEWVIPAGPCDAGVLAMPETVRRLTQSA
jgi:hypothetical protein